MRYRFLSPALREATAAAEYYEEQVTGLGRDFVEELDKTVDRIVCFPKAWTTLSKPFRRCSLRRFPYTVIYTIEETGVILIISVFHQSKEPLSWRENL